jgi:hypothetical protein
MARNVKPVSMRNMLTAAGSAKPKPLSCATKRQNNTAQTEREKTKMGRPVADHASPTEKPLHQCGKSQADGPEARA